MAEHFHDDNDIRLMREMRKPASDVLHGSACQGSAQRRRGA
jgi:hypothetical protein